MKVKKTVLQIVGENIKEFGFNYDPLDDYAHKMLWPFTRHVNHIKQRIVIQRDRFSRSLKLFFNTTARGREELPESFAKDFVPKNKYKITEYQGASYETEEDLMIVLHEFVEIIKLYGLKKLEALSIEGKIYSTVEMANALINHHEKLSLTFISKNEIFLTKTTHEAINDWFNEIGKILCEIKEVEFIDIKDIILEIAAFLGETIRKDWGGEWTVGKYPDVVHVNNIPTPCTVYSALNDTIYAWRKQDIDFFKFKFVQHYIHSDDDIRDGYNKVGLKEAKHG